MSGQWPFHRMGEFWLRVVAAIGYGFGLPLQITRLKHLSQGRNSKRDGEYQTSVDANNRRVVATGRNRFSIAIAHFNPKRNHLNSVGFERLMRLEKKLMTMAVFFSAICALGRDRRDAGQFQIGIGINESSNNGRNISCKRKVSRSSSHLNN